MESVPEDRRHIHTDMDSQPLPLVPFPQLREEPGHCSELVSRETRRYTGTQPSHTLRSNVPHTTLLPYPPPPPPPGSGGGSLPRPVATAAKSPRMHGYGGVEPTESSKWTLFRPAEVTPPHLLSFQPSNCHQSKPPKGTKLMGQELGETRQGAAHGMATRGGQRGTQQQHHTGQQSWEPWPPRIQTPFPPGLHTTPQTHPQLLIYCLESPEHLKAQDLVTKVPKTGQGEGRAAEALGPSG